MTGARKLCILLSPPVVQHVEQMAGNQLALFSYFEPLLELFRTEPHRALPPLNSVETTSWTMNEYSGYGTYSTARVGDDPRMLWDALDANKSLRLQFAGEHCSRTATGCVHGAYESGEVAANNVLQLLKR
jgi:polyamine oxidase